MTKQVSDHISYKGKTYPLYSEPLENYLNGIGWNPDNFPANYCSACSRGYIARWEIIGDTLRLSDVWPPLKSPSRAFFQSMFPGRNKPLIAKWFTGTLKIDFNELSESIQQLHIKIEKGMMLESQFVEVEKAKEDFEVSSHESKEEAKQQPQDEAVKMKHDKKRWWF